MNTVVYAIKNKITEKTIYVGSTSDYKKRQSTHKSSCKKNKPGVLYDYIREIGWDNIEFCILEIIEDPYKRYQLEREHIDLHVDLCNSNQPFRTLTEKIEYTLKQQKKYDDNHKEEKKAYYQMNKEKILEKNRLRYINNQRIKKELNLNAD